MKKAAWKWKIIAAVLALVAVSFGASAWGQVVQTPLKSNKIPQFVDPMPDINILASKPANATMETFLGPDALTLTMEEFKASVMPSTFVPATGVYTGTTVWGYRDTPPGAPENSYIGPIIIAYKDKPTQITWVNKLGDTNSSSLLAYTQSTDQTLHWANPNNLAMNDPARMSHYSGPIPAVPHLHGGEVPPWIDGGPDAWFLSDATLPSGYDPQGSQYYTNPNVPVSSNEAVYSYPNSQEPGNLWFHDHTLGMTRLNVYAGLAGAYPLVDPNLTFYADTLPAPIVPLVIQDRMFDVNGQLYFPNVGLNPAIHPFWIPEFVGDTIVVNGKVWPYYNVAAKQYRFFILNGSNARTYDLSIENKGGRLVPAMWQIGTDGGYLDFPVQVAGKTATPLILMPGERADVIIDFTGLPVGTTLLLINTAKTPFPGGAPTSGRTTGRVMMFNVVASDTDHTGGSLTLATTTALRGGSNQTPLISRLPGVPAGVAPAPLTPAGPALVLPGLSGANVTVWRQLTLNEIMGPGGPQEILVNNTKWNGKRPDGSDIAYNGNLTVDAAGNNLTELPAEGTTEVWDIINTTADAHPIHMHLTQFQLISRQDYDVKGYLALYGASFPGGSGLDMATGMNLIYPPGVYTPAFGPPFAYNLLQTAANQAQFVGGNPDVTPFLSKKPAAPPAANEMGWKDTIQAYPGQVTRIVVRFSPINSSEGTTYAFNPGGADYVWHCHIIDHEDNEMMRPYQVIPSSTALRSYVKGLDY